MPSWSNPVVGTLAAFGALAACGSEGAVISQPSTASGESAVERTIRSEVSGLWMVEGGARSTCRLVLTLRPSGGGYAVDRERCGADMFAGAAIWRVTAGRVLVTRQDGSAVLTLTRDGPDHLQGRQDARSYRLVRAPQA